MHVLILVEQSGYVEGAQILDEIIFAHETIDALKNTKKVGILIKLDMLKAFDKTSWRYIHHMFLVFGFSAQWTT